MNQPETGIARRYLEQAQQEIPADYQQLLSELP